MRLFFGVVALCLLGCSALSEVILPELAPRTASPPTIAEGAYYREGFVIAPKTFKNNHGASLAELSDGSIYITWFAGEKETAPDASIFGVSFSPKSGMYDVPRIVVKNGERPTDSWWSDQSVGNTALYVSGEGTLWLFYNAIPIGGWALAVVKYKTSMDGGVTWSDREVFLGQVGTLIRGKPIPLGAQEFLVPAYTELVKHQGFGCAVTVDSGKLQSKNCGTLMGKDRTIQPSVVLVGGGTLVAFLRDKDKNAVYRSESHDRGASWSIPQATNLPNPDSSVAATTLSGGRILIVYNNSREDRNRLSLALSEDNGKTFRALRDIEHGLGEYSYPEVLVARNGFIHVVYTHNRETIKHLMFNETWLLREK